MKCLDSRRFPTTLIALNLQLATGCQPFGRRDEAVAGTLMSYGPTIANLLRSAAEYVDKILRGSNPADLPVEQLPPELIVNMKTAKELGLKMSQSLLVRANEEIQ